VLAGAGYFSRPPYRRRHDLVVDHHDAQVLAFDECFKQHGIGMRPRRCDGPLQHFGCADVHRDTLALFATHRLDHQAAMLDQEVRVLLRAAGAALCRNRQSGLPQDTPGDGLVIASAESDGAGQFGQAFPANN
jgi:hypothetical protein